jgi:hypothetical protein
MIAAMSSEQILGLVGGLFGALIGLFGCALGLAGAAVGVYCALKGLKNQKQAQRVPDGSKGAA